MSETSFEAGQINFIYIVLYEYILHFYYYLGQRGRIVEAKLIKGGVKINLDLQVRIGDIFNVCVKNSSIKNNHSIFNNRRKK